MADWTDDKDLGPWPFTERGDVWGYLNNKRWSNQADAIAFCQARGLPLDLPDQHLPCGHWHKQYTPPPSKVPIVAGRWVAAMSQPGTPYIYLYDISYKAVIKLDTSANPIILAEVLSLDSAYALDCDMGRGNPGTQRGGYCMNKNGTRLWYLFCDQGQYPVTRDHPDAQLIEVDISGTTMSVVKKTLFPGLLPADPYPGLNTGRINDGCSDNTHTYWCTELIAGRVIKIRNSDHVIADDHTFNYPIEACSFGAFDEAIHSIDVDSNKLYWAYCRDHYYCTPSYNSCRHLIQAGLDLGTNIDDISCGTGLHNPAWQNMIRVYSGHILHHRAVNWLDFIYMPFMKRGLDFILESSISQQYLQNIFGVRSGSLFTLMHLNSVYPLAFLYCINFSDMSEISKIDISYYAGQKTDFGVEYDWDWTSVSAMNQQTGVIIIARYHNIELKNYVACFKAGSSLDLICDEGLDYITVEEGGNEEIISDEPQIWTMPG